MNVSPSHKPSGLLEGDELCSLLMESVPELLWVTKGWAPEGVILGSPLSTAVPLGLQENAMKIDSECATAPGFGFPGQGLLWGWG